MARSARIGFLAGVSAFSATVAYDVVQVLQVVGVLRFPLDDILIFATSLCIVLPFVLMVVALHDTTPADGRFWTQAALVLTTMYAVFAAANYVVQLTTVIPAKLGGAAASVRVLEQTPHSLFWDFDAAGYICMGIGLLLVVPVLSRGGSERVARLACVANALATVLAGVVYFSPTYSYKLLMLGFPWGITAPASMLFLALALRKREVRPAARVNAAPKIGPPPAPSPLTLGNR